MFEGKKFLITGGSSGIGRQLARDLLGTGAIVTIVSNDRERLKRAELELSDTRHTVDSISCDISDLNQVREMTSKYKSDHGCPDFLVNNAGFAVYRTFEESPSEEIGRLLGVNLLGAMYCTREILPAMIEKRAGHIVNVASIAGKIIITPNAIYCAAKHGMIAWSEALKAELARFGIGIHVICPGRVETEFFQHETFKTRAPRKETEFTVPIESVSKAIVSAIRHDRFLTFIPWTLGILAWLANVFPWPVRAGFQRLMRSRIETLYASKDHRSKELEQTR
ncbi:MAG: SDR family NAD(P)-dependent oxidoreductase [Syntrophobacteraceae bacterium]|jgi:short-subunit dehydrogenase